jgi:hypothetical protein
VFTKLFGEKDRLLGLYNALGDTRYRPETEITINTLHDALFMDRIPLPFMAISENPKLCVTLLRQMLIYLYVNSALPQSQALILGFSEVALYVICEHERG